MTWREQIYHAMRLAQLNKVAGREANTFEYEDALETLNAMLDAWNAESLMVPGGKRLVFPLEAGKRDYTVGLDGDWNTPRPARIDSAGIVVDGAETPLDVFRSSDEWARVYQKDFGSTQPCAVYVDPSAATLTLRFHPVPQTAYDVALYAWDQLLKVGALDDVAMLPPGGYEMAIRYNLAVELAASNPQNSISPLVISKAIQYKATVKRLNVKPVLMTTDVPGACSGHYDIRMGDYR